MRFLDTNVILRYLTRDDPAKAHACYLLLQNVRQGREQLQTTESVIAWRVTARGSISSYLWRVWRHGDSAVVQVPFGASPSALCDASG